jgi:hypothetical protein
MSAVFPCIPEKYKLSLGDLSDPVCFKFYFSNCSEVLNIINCIIHKTAIILISYFLFGCIVCSFVSNLREFLATATKLALGKRHFDDIFILLKIPSDF